MNKVDWKDVSFGKKTFNERMRSGLIHSAQLQVTGGIPNDGSLTYAGQLISNVQVDWTGFDAAYRMLKHHAETDSGYYDLATYGKPFEYSSTDFEEDSKLF